MFRFALLFPLALVSCKDETVSGYSQVKSEYTLQEVNGLPFPSHATISLAERGKITGKAPCNSYFAEQTAPYPWFELGSIAATKRACPDLRQEAKFFDAMQSMTLSEVSGPVLILSNESGGRMVFEAIGDDS